MQPLKIKHAFQTLCVRLTHVSLSLRLALFGMLLAQGIESNPGPGPGSLVRLEVEILVVL